MSGPSKSTRTDNTFPYTAVFRSRLFQHVAMLLEDDEHVEQQIAEIAGVEGFEALLVLRVKLAAAAVCVAFGLARVDIGGGEPLVLPLIDQPGELAGGEALFVEIGGGDELLQ